MSLLRCSSGHRLGIATLRVEQSETSTISSILYRSFEGRVTLRHPSDISVSIAVCPIIAIRDSRGSLHPGVSVRESRVSIGDSGGFNIPFRPGITPPGVSDSGILSSPHPGVGVPGVRDSRISNRPRPDINFPGVRDSGVSNSISVSVKVDSGPVQFQAIHDELSLESLKELL